MRQAMSNKTVFLAATGAGVFILGVAVYALIFLTGHPMAPGV
jgi:hypothetical protein